MELKDFENLWRSNIADLEETQKFWDMRADEFNSYSRNNEGETRRQQILDLLTAKGILRNDAEILDIGCGPGKYALEFAKKVKTVVGIDISPRMIQYAQDNAQRQNAANTVFELSAWESLNLDECGWNKKFDLVFASVCPGISSSESLLKLCRASKGACFISSFVERSDELRDELHRVIFGRDPEQRWGKNIYYAINILWLSGYYPEISYRDAEFEHAWPLEKAVELYSSQLKRMTKSNADMSGIEAKIAEYLGKVAENGLVYEKVKSKIAWLYWCV
ncbi:Ubiquinone biosynthesis O-methyltransferase, mitochondrial [Sporomusa carbonis]|uniref:class I SAM-dependent methyltransferase n=1 Tax=Sporomusa carbonis TaxID=3076075 RepID=UPI003A63D4BA